jgi:hypothetical protein
VAAMIDTATSTTIRRTFPTARAILRRMCRN